MQARPRTFLFKLIPVFLVIMVALWSAVPQGQALEERLGLELLFRMRGPITPPEDVVVVAITRDSARALGLSEKLHQWTREPYARVTQALSVLGARLVAFDVFFEAEREAVGDSAFQKAMADAGNVLLFVRSEQDQIGEAQLERLAQPYRPFYDAALASAPLVLPKVPARVSRFYLSHPAFSEQPTLIAKAWILQQDDQSEAYHKILQPPSVRLLNFYGPPRSVRTIEFSDVITAPEKVAPYISGATVFVGYSAEDQPDQRDGFYTAYTSQDGLDISGVELAATAYANLKSGIWIQEWMPWQNSLIVLILAAVAYASARYLTPLNMGAVLALVVVIYTSISYAAFSSANLWLPWVNVVVIALPLCGGLGMWVRSRELFLQKNRLQWAFGKYLPREELERLVAEKGLPALRDYHNSVCLVTDAQGFSRVSEQLSPVALAELMQDYYQAIIPPIRKAGGIISDVAGDGVIALWLHLDQEEAWAALKPVVAEISANVARFNDAHKANALPTRIGIHAGEIVLGHFGAMDHHEFRAMGDIINTTSRLEGANKQLGTQVLISESCVNAGDETLRYVGRFCFAGKHNPLRLYTLKQAPDPVLLKRYRLAVLKLEAGQFDEALKLFRTIARYYPEDGPNQFLVQYLSELHAEQKNRVLNEGVIFLAEK